MTEALLPCPFCGGEATIVERVVKGGYKVYYVKCKECGVRQNELPKTADGACDLWNCRAERTCRNLNPPSCRDFECSECGESSEFTPGFMPNYCPNCGARVVEEASDDADR